MSFTAGLVVLLFAAGGADEPRWSDEPTPTELTPTPKRATPQLNFDALPEPPKVADDARVKRFLGAFAGGVVGLGAAVALMPLGDGTGCFGGPCVSFVHGLVGVFAPLLSLGGAWLGYQLTGGDGGLFTPSAALVPAILLALGLSSIAGAQDSNSALSLMPFLIASGAFLAGFSALSLDTRSRQLEHLGAAASWGKAGGGRVAITALVALFAAGGAVGMSVLLFALGQYSALGLVLGTVGAAAGTLGAASAAWGVHRAMDGRGSFGSALAGFGIGWLTTFAGLGLFALTQSAGSFSPFGSPVRNTASTILFVELVAAKLAEGRDISLRGFGTLELRISKSKIGRNPKRPGSEVRIPDRCTVRFKPGRELKDRVARLPVEVVRANKGAARGGEAEGEGG